LTVFANELLETALWPAFDNILAPDFVVKGPHYPLLQVKIEIHVNLAIFAEIVPDRPRGRIATLVGRTKPILRIALVEANETLRIDRLALHGRPASGLLDGWRIGLASRSRRHGRPDRGNGGLRRWLRDGRRGWLLAAEIGA